MASQSFATYCGGDWVTLGQEKLRGVGQKVTVLLPGQDNMKLDDGDTIRNNAMETRSEAEQVMLLYRNSKKTAAARTALEQAAAVKIDRRTHIRRRLIWGMENRTIPLE